MKFWVCSSLVEHFTDNEVAEGSIPSTPIIILESQDLCTLLNSLDFWVL